jgi:ribosomal protein S18 acetylase RimI-like enzyme
MNLDNNINNYPDIIDNFTKKQSMWRKMSIVDLPLVYIIAMDIWKEYGESFTIYENKFLTSPEGCYVYDDNGIKGYIISHPWNVLYPPKLNTLLIKVEINCWFIHDIVILPEYRGKGIADEIIQKILSNNPIVSLVACDKKFKTKDFWMYYGFEVADTFDCDYGIYMVKKS